MQDQTIDMQSIPAENIQGIIAAHDAMAEEVARTSASAYPKPLPRIQTREQVRIVHVKINSFMGNDKVKVSALLKSKVLIEQDVTVTFEVVDGLGAVCAKDCCIRLQPNDENVLVETLLHINDARVWSPEDPFLYSLKTTVSDSDGRQVDRTKNSFGIRSIVIGEDQRLYLNGRPIYLRGSMWVPGYSMLPFEPSFCENLLHQLKRQGFNYIRHHSVVPPYDWYYDMCDRFGMMISVEMGFDLERTVELVTRHFNHPSLIFWAGVNETHKTGSMPEVKEWYKTVKALDLTRPVYDCSGWGEFDRDTTDILPQHFGYEYPYLKFEDLYERYDYYKYDGSAKDVSAEEIESALQDGSFKVDKPQIIHELQGNAQIYSDKTLVLDSRMRAIWEEHRYDHANWPIYVRVNQEFVRACYKVNYEAARRADNQIGFELLTVADSVVEYNRERRGPPFGDMDITGTCDALGDSKHYLVQDLPTLNAAHIVLIDTHSRPRTLWSDEHIEATVLTSCHDYAPPVDVTLEWRLKSGQHVVQEGAIDGLRLKYPGAARVAELDIPMPSVLCPETLTLEIDLIGEEYKVSNNWKFWLFPRPDMLAGTCGKRILTNIKWVKDLGISTEYSSNGLQERGPDLLITDHLGKAELAFLESGGRVLLLQDHTKEGFACTPTSYRHRMYHSWVGGHSMGVVVHDHPALGKFPHEGFNDLQFYQVLQSSDRLMLDDLPLQVMPILESVPCLEYNQSRNSGYLLELAVGKGKLLVSGLKLSMALKDECAASWLLYEFAKYCTSDRFDPADECTRVQLEEYMVASRERVWVTAGPLWYLYPAEDLDISPDGWETPPKNKKVFIPAGGKARAWINPVGDDGWGDDEWGWHGEPKAVDGYRAHYWEPRSLPADLGVEWPHVVNLSQVTVEFLDELSLPADDGWEFQIEQDGKWRTVEVVCEKASEKLWVIGVAGVPVLRFRLLFTKMNTLNLEAVARGAMAGGVRAGYPSPVSWLKEKSVPRVRVLSVSLDR